MSRINFIMLRGPEHIENKEEISYGNYLLLNIFDKLINYFIEEINDNQNQNMDKQNEENTKKEKHHVENKNKEMNLADIIRYNLEELDVNTFLNTLFFPFLNSSSLMDFLFI